VLQCVAVTLYVVMKQPNASVLQCIAVCCSVLQCVAVCCRVLQYVVIKQPNARVLQCAVVQCVVLQFVAVCCSVLQCVAVTLCVVIKQPIASAQTLQHIATHCKTLQQTATKHTATSSNKCNVSQ